MTRLPVRPSALLAFAIGAYAVGFGSLSVLRHRAFETGRFDLGNMVQAVWATAHGHPLAVTDLAGDQVSRLSAHADPILILFAPLWWLWPSAAMLLTVQATAVALGAVPVYLLALKHLGSRRAALGFGLVYLLLPAVQWLTLNEFHPVALACPLLLLAFWYLDEDRLVAFGIVALLAAATKEEIAIVAAGFGIWYAIARGKRLQGAVIAVLGAAVAAVAVGVVIPHFNDGSGSSFYSRYGEIGGSPSGVARTAIHDPGRILSAAFAGRDLRYLAELTLPLGALFLLSPLVLLAAVPELAINVLSSTPTQTSIHFHYTAGAIPVLVVASVLGAGRLVRLRPAHARALGGAAVAIALGANYLLGAIPLWRELPGGEGFQASATRVTEHDRIASRALASGPSRAVVSATNSLGAHLSARRRVLSFPYLADATWVAVDETQPSNRDRFEALPAAVHLVSLRQDRHWRLVFSEDGVLVFRRVSKS